MNREWLKVLIAALFEICWVIGLKHAAGFWEWTGTVIAIVVSFSLLIHAGKRLPIGTVYAVFTGMGTAGTVLSGIVFFGEAFSVVKLALILLLLAGVMGLKLITDSQEKAEKELS